MWPSAVATVADKDGSSEDLARFTGLSSVRQKLVKKIASKEYMDYSCPSPGRCRRMALAARMHLTAASWFDFEVEAKPYTCSGGRIGPLPVILLCFAFWGYCPFHCVRSPDVAAVRHAQFIGDTQNRRSCRPCYGSRTGSAREG